LCNQLVQSQLVQSLLKQSLIVQSLLVQSLLVQSLLVQSLLMQSLLVSVYLWKVYFSESFCVNLFVWVTVFFYLFRSHHPSTPMNGSFFIFLVLVDLKVNIFIVVIFYCIVRHDSFLSEK